MGNMYGDLVQMINPTYGCKFDCIYCEGSYKRQAKRQKHRCKKCYNFEVHEHLSRLDNVRLKKTEGDQFIWISAFGDISFAHGDWFTWICIFIEKNPNHTFFIQTKNPRYFNYFDTYPNNLILGITLETNRDEGYNKISKAPPPSKRIKDFKKLKHKKKRITIEPILDFDLAVFFNEIVEMKPEKVYIGYDTKNTKGMNEPPVWKTMNLIDQLSEFTRVKKKYIPGE